MRSVKSSIGIEVVSFVISIRVMVVGSSKVEDWCWRRRDGARVVGDIVGGAVVGDIAVYKRNKNKVKSVP